VKEPAVPLADEEVAVCEDDDDSRLHPIVSRRLDAVGAARRAVRSVVDLNAVVQKEERKREGGVILVGSRRY
jgi:hypothetical protein